MDKLKSRKAEVGEQLDRSRVAVPVRGAGARRSRIARHRRPIGEPLLEGRRARRRPRPDPRQKTTSPGAGLAPDAPEPRGRELHQPPAQGQAAGLGRPRKRKGQARTADQAVSPARQRIGLRWSNSGSDRGNHQLENITHSHERIAVDGRLAPPNRWKPAPTSSARPTTR